MPRIIQHLVPGAAVALLLAPVGALVHHGGVHEQHPRFELVNGSIETLWQRPHGNKVKGVLFAAHGCRHQATDFFTDLGSDGWSLAACRSSAYGRCLGLPEERDMVRAARQRGYLVVAVSGGTRHHRKCWAEDEDVPRVQLALEHVFKAEQLPPETPIFATGVSAGGWFLGYLVKALPGRITCVAPQAADTPLFGTTVPVLFIHMPKDGHLEETLQWRMRALKEDSPQRHVGEILVEPRPLDEFFLSRAMLPERAFSVMDQLTKAGWLNATGFLKEDPRKSHIRTFLKSLQLPDDKVVGDESPLFELLDVAWGEHSFTGLYTDQMLDFCEKWTKISL